MKQKAINLAVILITLTLTGILRLSFEDKLSHQMRELELMPIKYDLDTRIALKQTGFTVGFGSLRPTIAAFMAQSAFDDHAKQNWQGLETKFNDIVLLDPKNLYYWDVGSWHMISNASSYYRDNKDLPPIVRKNKFKLYIDKGTDFLERGIKMNPKSWKIRELLARRYADKFRLPDYAKAAEQYQILSSLPDVPPAKKRYFRRHRLYSLNKIPEQHQQAYDLALKLYNEDPANRYPAVLTSIWVGQNHPLNKVSKRFTLSELFGNLKTAYKYLRIRYLYPNKLEPQYGVKQAVQKLESLLHIPNSKRAAPIKPLFLNQ